MQIFETQENSWYNVGCGVPFLQKYTLAESLRNSCSKQLYGKLEGRLACGFKRILLQMFCSKIFGATYENSSSLFKFFNADAGAMPMSMLMLRWRCGDFQLFFLWQLNIFWTFDLWVDLSRWKESSSHFYDYLRSIIVTILFIFGFMLKKLDMLKASFKPIS